MVYFADFLIFIAFMLVITDFFAMSYGVFTSAGAILFVIGTIILFYIVHNVPIFFIRIVLPTYVTLTVFVSIFAYLGYKAYKTKVKTGESLLLNQTGEVVSDVNPNKDGKILINGELWTAYSDYAILKGNKATVVKVDVKLRLKVKPEEA
ncbi:MAG: NfeD family protein [Candidatus Acidulodesulfobacterium sp.]